MESPGKTEFTEKVVWRRGLNGVKAPGSAHASGDRCRPRAQLVPRPWGGRVPGLRPGIAAAAWVTGGPAAGLDDSGTFKISSSTKIVCGFLRLKIDENCIFCFLSLPCNMVFKFLL